ncbi:MAG: hypothetical protein IKR05_08375 [Prevotella sp.]|nr:hypothetical protein [Prevotella sp.]
MIQGWEPRCVPQRGSHPLLNLLPPAFFCHPPTKKAEVYSYLVPRYGGHTARLPSLRLWSRVSRQEAMGRLQPMRGKSAFPGGGASRNRRC